MIFITDYFFLGPTNSTFLVGNLNFWGLVMTFLTMLLQFKSAHYETIKANSTAEDKEVTFPYSTWYKKNGLSSLEIAQAINIVVFTAFWIRFFSEGWTFYDDGYTFSSFGSGVMYFYILCRQILIHNVPLLVTTLSIYMSNLIFLETDWWLGMQTGLLYLFVDYTLNKIYGE